MTLGASNVTYARRSDGGTIAVELAGLAGGTPLLVCHGLADSRRCARLLDQAARGRGVLVLAPDRPGAFIDGYLEACRAGVTQDLRVLTRPWGFDLRSIRVPTYVHHGDADTTVPPEHHASSPRRSHPHGFGDRHAEDAGGASGWFQ